MRNILFASLFALPLTVSSQSFELPANGDSVLGSLSLTTSRHEDTISDLAWAYDQGFLEMRNANPNVDTWLPGEGTEIIVPTHYVLPQTPRKGIVINVPEMRLYYYPKAKKGETANVVTYPISIGRQDWQTPHGQTRIVSKIKDPSWTPPASIKREHAEMGEILPDVVPAGPDNPLGAYAMRLGITGYLIHGTNKPYGLGMRVTHGCIRLYPKDIEQLFAMTPVNTSVSIINQPYKAGWRNNELYLEVHLPLEEDKSSKQTNYQRLVDAISAVTDAKNLTPEQTRVKVDWNRVRSAMQEARGIPVLIGQVAQSALPLITDASDTENYQMIRAEEDAGAAKPAAVIQEKSPSTATQGVTEGYGDLF